MFFCGLHFVKSSNHRWASQAGDDLRVAAVRPLRRPGICRGGGLAVAQRPLSRFPGGRGLASKKEESLCAQSKSESALGAYMFCQISSEDFVTMNHFDHSCFHKLYKGG